MKKTILSYLLCILYTLCVFSSLASSAENIGLSATAKTDFDQATYRASQRISNYEKALKSGNSDTIRTAALELQKDPLAIRQVNTAKSDIFKNRLNRDIRAVQIKTKALIRKELAKIHNVPESAVTFFEATNPSNEVKVGQDWDVTAQVNGKDVELKLAKKVTHEAFYRAAKGKMAPSAAVAEHFAESQSVEVTNRSHAEAYGGGGKKRVFNKATGKYEVMTEGGEIIAGDKSKALRDSEQLSKVMEHKSHLGKNNADNIRQTGEKHIRDNKLTGQAAEKVRRIAEADAQAWEMEQARQYTKQYKRQVEPRVAAHGGSIHQKVVKGTAILDKVAKGEISMAEGRARLKEMGETPESIISKGSSQIEAAQKAKDSPKSVLARNKAGTSPQGVFTDNVKDSIALKRLQAKKQQPKSLLDGGKSSFQGDNPPPEYKPKATLEEVRAKAEAKLQSEKLRTGKSINRPKSVLDGGKSSVGKANTPVVQGADLAKAANSKKGPGKSPSGPSSKAKVAVATSDKPPKQAKFVKTGIQGPSAKNTNPGGQLEAMGIKDTRKTLTPEQAGVKMPGRIDPNSPEGLNKTKQVKDPKLANSGKKPASLLDGGKSSSSHTPKAPSKAAQLDQAVGAKIQKKLGVGEIPKSSSGLRKGFTKYGDKAMGAAAVAGTALEGEQAGEKYGEGWLAKKKAEIYRKKGLEARKNGNFTVADKYDKRAEEYEKEASTKMSEGLKKEAALVGGLAVAATATGGAALGVYGTYKTGEASYGAGKTLSEKVLKEEFEREIAQAQKEGRKPNAALAKARALARVGGEATGARWVMEQAMRDREAEKAGSETDKRLSAKREAAIENLDVGLDEIADFERKLRNLDKNKLQNSPWVQQERERLTQAYNDKRKELQAINNRLGDDAGKENGAYIAIRSAVSLLPEKEILTTQVVKVDEQIAPVPPAVVEEQLEEEKPEAINTIASPIPPQVKPQQEGEIPSSRFTKVALNQELDDGRMYFLYHTKTPAEDRFRPPTRKVKPALFRMQDLRPEVETYDIKHNREHQQEYPKYNKDKLPYDSKELMLKEDHRIRGERIYRLKYKGQTRYLWGSDYTDYYTKHTGDTTFYNLQPGKHTIQVTLWLKNGYRFDDSFTITVGDYSNEKGKNPGGNYINMEREEKSLIRGREAIEKAGAKFHQLRQHLESLLKYVPRTFKQLGKTPKELQPVFDEIYTILMRIKTFKKPKYWKPQRDKKTWQQYREREYRNLLLKFALLIAKHGGAEHLGEALAYAEQLGDRGAAKVYRKTANSYYSYTGDHQKTWDLLLLADVYSDNAIKKTRAKGEATFFTGSLSTEHSSYREEWPKALIPHSEIQANTFLLETGRTPDTPKSQAYEKQKKPLPETANSSSQKSPLTPLAVSQAFMKPFFAGNILEAAPYIAPAEREQVVKSFQDEPGKDLSMYKIEEFVFQEIVPEGDTAKVFAILPGEEKPEQMGKLIRVDGRWYVSFGTQYSRDPSDTPEKSVLDKNDNWVLSIPVDWEEDSSSNSGWIIYRPSNLNKYEMHIRVKEYPIPENAMTPERMLEDLQMQDKANPGGLLELLEGPQYENLGGYVSAVFVHLFGTNLVNDVNLPRDTEKWHWFGYDLVTMRARYQFIAVCRSDFYDNNAVKLRRIIDEVMIR